MRMSRYWMSELLEFFKNEVRSAGIFLIFLGFSIPRWRCINDIIKLSFPKKKVSLIPEGILSTSRITLERRIIFSAQLPRIESAFTSCDTMYHGQSKDHKEIRNWLDSRSTLLMENNQTQPPIDGKTIKLNNCRWKTIKFSILTWCVYPQPELYHSGANVVHQTPKPYPQYPLNYNNKHHIQKW